MIRLDAALLKPILARHLGSAGVDRESLDHVVDSLMQTSLRGVDSHGIQLFPHYVRAARAGRINVAPRITIEDTGASTAILDADHAFGHRAGADAIDHAVDLAAKTGVGAVIAEEREHEAIFTASGSVTGALIAAGAKEDGHHIAAEAGS